MYCSLVLTLRYFVSWFVLVLVLARLTSPVLSTAEGKTRFCTPTSVIPVQPDRSRCPSIGQERPRMPRVESLTRSEQLLKVRCLRPVKWERREVKLERRGWKRKSKFSDFYLFLNFPPDSLKPANQCTSFNGQTNGFSKWSTPTRKNCCDNFSSQKKINATRAAVFAIEKVVSLSSFQCRIFFFSIPKVFERLPSAFPPSLSLKTHSARSSERRILEL